MFTSMASALEAYPEFFQAPCAPRDSLIEHLKDRYSERLIMRGFIDESQLLEVYATPDAVTWTLVLVRADGVACMLATGRNLENVIPKLLKPTGQPA